jgi:hypothetical protein
MEVTWIKLIWTSLHTSHFHILIGKILISYKMIRFFILWQFELYNYSTNEASFDKKLYQHFHLWQQEANIKKMGMDNSYIYVLLPFKMYVMGCIRLLWKRKFKQWLSTFLLISAKPTITSHLNWLNTKWQAQNVAVFKIGIYCHFQLYCEYQRSTTSYSTTEDLYIMVVSPSNENNICVIL